MVLNKMMVVIVGGLVKVDSYPIDWCIGSGCRNSEHSFAFTSSAGESRREQGANAGSDFKILNSNGSNW